MDFSALPAVNASLNAAAMVLLVAAVWLVRRGHEEAHRRAMIGAFALSSLFLVLYVAHKASRGFENTPFHAEGAAHTAYLVLLASHVLLAMTVPVLAIAMMRLGLRDRRTAHRRLARVAWPTWMYVSVTGVVIYLLLYHLNPEPAAPQRAMERPAARERSGLAAPASQIRTSLGEVLQELETASDIG